MTDASNLPNWPGSASCYSRAYRLLEQMAQSGHVERRRVPGKRKQFRCFPSEEMNELITALNDGNEEFIKGTLLQNRAPLHRV